MKQYLVEKWLRIYLFFTFEKVLRNQYAENVRKSSESLREDLKTFRLPFSL